MLADIAEVIDVLIHPHTGIPDIVNVGVYLCGVKRLIQKHSSKNNPSYTERSRPGS
jgi:hypothetical protein